MYCFWEYPDFCLFPLSSADYGFQRLIEGYLWFEIRSCYFAFLVPWIWIRRQWRNPCQSVRNSEWCSNYSAASSVLSRTSSNFLYPRREQSSCVHIPHGVDLAHYPKFLGEYEECLAPSQRTGKSKHLLSSSSYESGSYVTR